MSAAEARCGRSWRGKATNPLTRRRFACAWWPVGLKKRARNSSWERTRIVRRRAGSGAGDRCAGSRWETSSSIKTTRATAAASSRCASSIKAPGPPAGCRWGMCSCQSVKLRERCLAAPISSRVTQLFSRQSWSGLLVCRHNLTKMSTTIVLGHKPAYLSLIHPLGQYATPFDILCLRTRGNCRAFFVRMPTAIW